LAEFRRSPTLRNDIQTAELLNGQLEEIDRRIATGNCRLEVRDRQDGSGERADPP
jgi:hypothetical protein